jgi:hypothetical protein
LKNGPSSGENDPGPKNYIEWNIDESRSTPLDIDGTLGSIVAAWRDGSKELVVCVWASTLLNVTDLVTF